MLDLQHAQHAAKLTSWEDFSFHIDHMNLIYKSCDVVMKKNLVNIMDFMILDGFLFSLQLKVKVMCILKVRVNG